MKVVLSLLDCLFLQSLMSMKLGSEVREAEEQREQERRRNTLILILGYLSEHGFNLLKEFHSFTVLIVTMTLSTSYNKKADAH